jgi:hypothetical protein
MADMTQTTRASSTKIVFVGCKLPNGLRLQLFAHDPITTDPTHPRAWFPPPVQAEITLKGANSLQTDFSVRGLSPLNYQFAVTPVPADFWEAWIAKNANHDAIKSGFIFVVDRERDVRSAAREREPERTGIEPLNPDSDPRVSSKNAPPEQRVQADPDRLASLTRANGR